MDIAVIKDEAQYQAALHALDELMDRVTEPDSPEADQLELLSLVLADYENKHHAICLPDPVDAIKFRMEQQGLKPRDLVPYIGSASRVSEILARKRPLTLRMIRALNRHLGIPAEVLIQEPGAELPDDPDLDWEAFPLKEMLKRGWLAGFRGNLTDLKAHAEEVIGGFLRVLDEHNAAPALYRQTAHLRSARDMDRYALLAWQARVLHKALDAPPKAVYQPGSVTPEWLRDLAKLSWHAQGPALAREYLHAHGVALVIERHLPKTYLDGAALCTGEGRPVIALTLRHDRLDNFWFTLMHELAHVALHFNDGCETYLDDLDRAQPEDEVEQQADTLAGESLLPNAVWRDSKARVTRNKHDVLALAKQLNIHPAIIAGRIRFETGNYRLLSRLLGHGEVSNQLINYNSKEQQ